MQWKIFISGALAGSLTLLLIDACRQRASDSSILAALDIDLLPKVQAQGLPAELYKMFCVNRPSDKIENLATDLSACIPGTLALTAIKGSGSYNEVSACCSVKK